MSALCGLEKMGVLLSLAASIHYHRHLLYRLDTVHWDQLPAPVRHQYLELAQDVLGGLKPADVPAPPSALFEQAVADARRAAGRVLAFGKKQENV